MREDRRDLHYRGEAYRKMLMDDNCGDICKAIMSCSTKKDNGNYVVNYDKVKEIFNINKREIVECLRIYRG